jgi:hypothetical protein
LQQEVQADLGQQVCFVAHALRKREAEAMRRIARVLFFIGMDWIVGKSN